MQGVIQERRVMARRTVADRRFAIPRRTRRDRRVQNRRTVSVRVETDRRQVDERRGDEVRRLDRMPRGPNRRFGDRRTRRHIPRMIVVEGDELVRQGLARILVDAGYEAIQARDGLAALRCAWESPADVVLVNMKLPDMSGVELIRQMEQECPGCTVVAISGRRTYGVPDPLAVVAKFKNVRGLRKPFTPAALVDVVKGLMAQ